MFASRRNLTTISEGLTVVGLVTSDGEVEVHGTVEGDIRCVTVFVGGKGHVSGSIRADNVVVDGTVEGPVECRDIIFHRKANVSGNVACDTVTVEKGAQIQGRLSCAKQTDSAVRINDAATVADRRAPDERFVEIESVTRRVELIAEARTLSGNPTLVNAESDRKTYANGQN